MSKLSLSAFLSKWTTKFADNTSRLITEGFMREFSGDIKDSFLNTTDQNYDGVQGTKPGINTIANLKTIATVGLSTGITVHFRDTGNSDAFRMYELVSGTDVEHTPDIVRPSDYNATTNQKVWKIAVAGGDFLYTGASPATVTLNGITAGDDLSTLTIVQIIEKILASSVVADTILTESGDHILTESGDKILLE